MRDTTSAARTTAGVSGYPDYNDVRIRRDCTMLEPLKREDFDPLLDTELPLQVGATPTTARLVEVRALQGPSPRAHAPFSLTFVVPDTVESGQGTHCLTHPTLGAVELFMVPIGRESGGIRYEAIFN